MGPPTGHQFNVLIQAYSICTMILFIKWFVALMGSAESANHPSEDEKYIGKVAEPEAAVLFRRKRVFANDMENIPINLTIFWAAFLLQYVLNFQRSSAGLLNSGAEGTLGLTILICVYTGCRVLFHICYLYSLQPFRTIFFILGNLSTATVACFLIAAAGQINMKNFGFDYE